MEDKIHEIEIKQHEIRAAKMNELNLKKEEREKKRKLRRDAVEEITELKEKHK